MSRAPRWWRHLRAWLGGYFWLPCEVCGEPFGGHEQCGSVPVRRNSLGDVATGRCICVLCAVERQEFLEKYNEEFEGVMATMRGEFKAVTHRFPYASGGRIGKEGIAQLHDDQVVPPDSEVAKRLRDGPYNMLTSMQRKALRSVYGKDYERLLFNHQPKSVPPSEDR